jgi:hypothetical protein
VKLFKKFRQIFSLRIEEKTMKQRYFLLITILVLAISLTSAQSLVLEVDKDAFICDCQPDANNPSGPDTKLFQGPYYVSSHQCYARTVSSWDLSSLPQGITITQATIEFKCISTYGSMTGQMVFYRFIQAWGETTITTNNMPQHTSQDSIVKNWPSAGQWLSIDATKLVRFWYEHPDSNFGMYGHCVNTTSANGAAAFNSSRAITAADRPKLTITYTVTDVASEGTVVPSQFRLDAYPNPFNPTTNISFTLEKSGRIYLNVFDLNGRIVDKLVDSYQSMGQHQLQWNANRFSSGIYLISLTCGEMREVKKVALMK